MFSVQLIYNCPDETKFGCVYILQNISTSRQKIFYEKSKLVENGHKVGIKNGRFVPVHQKDFLGDIFFSSMEYI